METDTGIVQKVTYPLVVTNGLRGARPHEIVVSDNGEYGEIFALGKDDTTILFFGENPPLVGTQMKRTNMPLSVPVGDEYRGHIINPLGTFLTENGTTPKEKRHIEIVPPGIPVRKKITKPFQTGTCLVDFMVPLGKGQKELVLGDRKTGKTSFITTAIHTQMHEDTICIYAGIGRKKEEIKSIQEHFLQTHPKAKSHLIIVTASPADSPSLIYLTPYTAMTIAEYFVEKGNDVLLVLDDLSTHARFYREVSLLAKSFPGRDSYPGDIFYAHARLLERAGNFIHKEKGEVSLTCLPVAEMTDGDFSDYIATNLMGITDGHIYFDNSIFEKGRRPAINIGLSVTRVGRQTQTKLLQEIQDKITTVITDYEHLRHLSHFGDELTDTAQKTIQKGALVYSFFDQEANTLIPSIVNLILFGLLWIDAFTETDLAQAQMFRKNLAHATHDPLTKTLYKKITDAAALSDLLSVIQENKKQLLLLCKHES